MSKHTLWVEKYRPQSITECALTASIQTRFENMLENKDIQNMLLYGPAGTGKTTAAVALCKDLGVHYLVINGSKENGIDVLRTDIQQFASTASFTGMPKVVIIDEADFLRQDSTQPALRAFIEEFSVNCRFIFTVNYPLRLMPELKSRLKEMSFNVPKEERSVLAKKYAKMAHAILDKEGVEYDKKLVAQLVVRYFPDFRHVLIELQGNVSGGKLLPTVLSADISLEGILPALRTKNFGDARQWAADVVADGAVGIFSSLYHGLIDRVSDPAQFVVLLGEYQFKASHVMDQEINLAALLVEIMAVCDVN